MADSEQLTAVAALLQSTLSVDPAVRRKAEEDLGRLRNTPRFSVLLLQLVSMDAADKALRQSAAIFFKNLVKSRWNPKSGESDIVPITDTDKEEVRRLLVSVMLVTPPGVRKILSDCLTIISEHDFPRQWPTLLPELVSKLQTGDWNIINGVLHTLHSVFRRYRNAFRTNAIMLELKDDVLPLFAPPMLEVFKGTFAMIEANASNKAVLGPLFTALRCLLKIFYSLNWLDIPEFFEDNLPEYMPRFLTILTMKNPLLDSEDDDKAGPLVKAKSLVCQCINLYMEKYEEEFAPFLQGFVSAVWGELTSVSTEAKFDRLAIAAMQFLTTVSKSVHHALFASPDAQKVICEQVVIPNIKVRDEDEEMFEDNPVEYIRRDMEGSDADTRRRIACELVKGLCKHYDAQITGIFSTYVGALLAEHAADPAKNWKAKDAAIYLITALAARSASTAAGITSTNALVPIVDFYTSHVVTDLASGDISSLQMLKADALKFTSTFRNQLPKEAHIALLPMVARFLASPQQVLHSYAAICIERMLTVKDKTAATSGASSSSSSNRWTKTDLSTHLPVVIPLLFQVFTHAGSQENEYAMRALMRVATVAQDSMAPVLGDALPRLTTLLTAAARNPANPSFNHYMFETVAALIKNNAPTVPGALDGFESSLFPVFQSILTLDVQEFTPYVFQIMSQMLEMRNTNAVVAGVPAGYMSVYPALVVPTLWERPGNVPALTRLLQAYMRKCPAELAAAPALIMSTLGVFQKLVSTRQHDHEGFKLLESIVDGLPTATFAPHMGTIFTILFTRLQTPALKTPKYLRAFVEFLSFFVAKHGPTFVMDSVNALQPNLFKMVLENVWLNEMSKVTGSLERRVLHVAMVRLLCECPGLLAEPYMPASWTRAFNSLVTSLIASAEGSGGDAEASGADDDIYATEGGTQIGVGEGGASGAGGEYSAAFAQLVFSMGTGSGPENARTAVVASIPPSTLFLASSLSSLLTRTPQLLSVVQSCDAGCKTALSGWARTGGIPLPF